MPGPADVAKLNRALSELDEVIAAALKGGRLKDSERRLLRAEIEVAQQRLDELRGRLAG